MRKILIAALAALTALAAVAVAGAQSGQAPGAEITVSVSPSKVGTKKKPKPAKITLEVRNADSTQTADALEIFQAKNLVVSGKGLPKCSQSRLESGLSTSSCPSASRIGKGVAEAVAGVNGSAPREIQFNITAFLLGDKKVGFLLDQQDGDINVLATGTYKRASGLYGTVLDVDIPQLAREFPPGTFNGLKSIETTLYKKKGSRSLYKTNGCPSTRNLPFRTDISFQANPGPPKVAEIQAEGVANCRR